MGVILEKTNKSFGMSEEDISEDDALIDPEDQLNFLPEEKFINVLKNTRDLVHIEITINVVCDTKCKGLCFECGGGKWLWTLWRFEKANATNMMSIICF